MSFVLGGITYYEPGDLSLLPAASIDGVISYIGNTEYRTVIAGFKLAGTYEAEIRNGSPLGKVEISSAGQISVSSPVKVLIYAGDQVQFYTGGNSINTRPPANGTAIVADSFVEWSSRAFKSDIIDLPLISLPHPKKYKVAAKEKYGFIAEEMPAPLRVETSGENGKTELGVDLMGVIAVQAKRLAELETRVANLEAKI